MMVQDYKVCKDVTVTDCIQVATAIPVIVSDFQAFAEVSWIITA